MKPKSVKTVIVVVANAGTKVKPAQNKNKKVVGGSN